MTGPETTPPHAVLPDGSQKSRSKPVIWLLWVGAVLTAGFLWPFAAWYTARRKFTGKSIAGLAVAGLVSVLIIGGLLGGDPATEGDTVKASDSEQQRDGDSDAAEDDEPADEPEEKEVAVPADESAAEPKPEPEPQPAPAPAPTPAVDPMVALSKDVRKNTNDVFDDSVQDVQCDNSDGDRFCLVVFEMPSMWDGDEEEMARNMGGLFHELFRDTTSNYITAKGVGPTVDELGNEKADQPIMTVGMRRSGWEQVNWDNLQYSDPTKLEAVSEMWVRHVS